VRQAKLCLRPTWACGAWTAVSLEHTQNNRSRSQVIRLGPELEKVEKEIANYRRFGELCSELVAVNEQLCRLRSVPEIKDERELTRLKKTLQRKYSKK
jgi:hypothetical protein